MGIAEDGSNLAATHDASVRVLDIQSDWQTTEDDSFWVSATDRPVLLHPDPVADAARMRAATSCPSTQHIVTKAAAADDPRRFHIASQSRYGLTIADHEGFSMPFYTPHAHTSLTAQLYAVQASPDGTFIGVGGADGLFHVLQVPSAQSIQLEGHVSDVTHVDFFPSSLVALTGSTDFSLRIWSLQSFKCGAVLSGHRGAIRGMGILGRGRNVVSCANDRQVKVWHCGSGKSFREWTLPSTPTCMSVVAGFHAAAGPRLPRVDDLEFETDGACFFVGTDEHGVVGLDARMADPAMTLPSVSAVSAVHAAATASTHMLVVGGDDGSICTYDLRETSTPLYMTSRSNATVHAIAFIPGNEQGAAWIASGDGSCTRWDALWSSAPVVTGELVGPTYDAVNGVCVSRHGVSTVSRDRGVRTYTEASPQSQLTS
ncbi:Aste57867_21766 [Aphanomyces stellatus]|uniref:Aste57867_21766 protein n=1 Tax=Aphanomyces stellatus TaxID=120398 RepID=A0A485LIE6_9STRA|nr:hypothetical protein As57867_021697 [Aphanomyces stellatus]VFT98435.1 Aste57867_21766 [Aphanomyces stellatus]